MALERSRLVAMLFLLKLSDYTPVRTGTKKETRWKVQPRCEETQDVA